MDMGCGGGGDERLTVFGAATHRSARLQASLDFGTLQETTLNTHSIYGPLHD